MNLLRYIQEIVTCVPRFWHRHGFGIHSPHDYELVKDVLYENLSYYAYDEQNLVSSQDKQLYRIKLHFAERLVCIGSVSAKLAKETYEVYASSNDDTKVLVVESLNGSNYSLWKHILDDQRARVTFDMGKRGLVLFDRKRIKQNYLL